MKKETASHTEPQVIRLRLGDSLELLREMNPGTIDVIVSDPPYGISFMGKEWDSFNSSNLDEAPQEDSVQPPLIEFQRWNTVWLKECYRVLTPGGKLGVVKAFSGTRTFHRLAQAMEDAGFVLDPEHSLEAWVYGCLSEDSEILTEHGWKPGLTVDVGERVACWDPITGSIRLDAVEEVFQAPYAGEMISFRNDNTDQLLTPNHRVYKKHQVRHRVDGKRTAEEEPEWNVQQAGEINREDNLRLPLAGTHNGPGAGGEDWVRLLAWVWTEGDFDSSAGDVHLYQSSVNMDHVEEIRGLLSRVAPGYKEYSRERAYKDRVYTEYTWSFSGDLAQRVRESLPDKRPTWKLLWAMTQDEKHAFVDAAIKGDESYRQGQLVFHQKDPEDLVWFQTLAHLMNRQGRINPREVACELHRNPQTQLQSRHLKASMSVHYEGNVWCVKVPTGAFLARRADKVFITGNSGFPKSHNVSRALDDLLGEKGNVIRTETRWNEAPGLVQVGQGPRMKIEREILEPSSDDAKRFEGYGTALKPSWEPIVVGKKI